MSYDVTIERMGPCALFDLKGARDAVADWSGEVLPGFPGTPNRRTERDDTELFHIGRDHWLLRTGLEREEALIAALRPDEAPSGISIVRISDTLTFFGLSGADAGQVMAIASPLDLHPSIFPQDAVSFTEAFGLKALVLRRAGGFEMAVEQSYGDMVADYFARAAS